MIAHIALVLAGSGSLPTPPAPPFDLSAGLVAYYPFDGNADDASGNGRHGTVYGATLAPDRSGTPDGAYSFDGVDDFIDADGTGLPPGERTVALWFYARNDDRPVMMGYGGGSCGSSWFMGLNCPLAAYQNRCYVTSHCDWNTFGRPYSVPPTNRWIHWAITTAASGTRIYIDGRRVASTPAFIANTATVGTELSFGVAPSPSGLAPYTDGNVRFLDGLLDDIRIYDRALSGAEIKELAGVTSPMPPTLRQPIVVLPWIVVI